MGGKGFSPKLKTYVEKNYKDTKSDLFAVILLKDVMNLQRKIVTLL